MPSGHPSALSEKVGWHRRFQQTIVRLRVACAAAGVVCLLLTHGFPQAAPGGNEWDRVVFALFALVLTVMPLLEWWFSPARRQHAADHVLDLTAVVVTLAGAVVLGAILPESVLGAGGHRAALATWWQMVVAVWAGLVLFGALRRVSYLGLSPAATLVLSFAVVILFGTLLLMLPRATAGGGRTSFVTALFTSTSATCVTGLVVVDTGEHWSRWGQAVILILFQVGGLGIMTFGAFFALMVGRGLMVSESVLLGDLLEESTLSQIKRLVLAILAFTLVSEAVAAVLLSGLWSDRSWHDQVFYSVFHAVSGFCNAGFSLFETSFEGYETRWQVWGVLSGVILLGGIGFSVLYNLAEILLARLARPMRQPLFTPPQPRPKLRVTSRLVLVTSGLLLVAGTLGVLLLEWPGASTTQSWGERLAHSWFQSVTSRTAGFNTMPIDELGEGTQFFIMLLMFVGASPGSTGGGVKTVALATTALAAVAILRGRDRVEVCHRTIPEDVVRRALLIVSLGAAVVVGATVVLVALEHPPRGAFVAHLFEVTSAFATVGLSTGITPELGVPGRILILVLMFAGRVGPLTLMLALVDRSTTPRYRYPEERVMLG